MHKNCFSDLDPSGMYHISREGVVACELSIYLQTGVHIRHKLAFLWHTVFIVRNHS